MDKFTAGLNNLSFLIILGLSFLLPVAFTPLTSEFYDTAKLILLALATLALLLIWGIRIVAENKIRLTKTPLDLPLLIFLSLAVLSTIFSPSPYTSLFGVLPKVHGSTLFEVTLILFYFLIVWNINTKQKIDYILQALLTSGVILSTVSLLSYFKIYLPFSFAQSQNFSLAGNNWAGALTLSILLPVSLYYLIKSRATDWTKTVGVVSSFTFATVIILTGNLASWVGALIGAGLVIFYNRPARENIIIITVITIITIILGALIYTPTLRDKTELGKFSQTYQKDIQLPFLISWKISASAFRDSPILGTGPSTYLYNFTQYKPIEFNRTDIWNLRINSAHNLYLQTWAENGGLGVLVYLLASVIFAGLAIKHLKNPFPQGLLSITGLTFIITSALSPQTVLTQTTGFLILGLFFASLLGTKITEVVIELSGYSRERHVLIPAIVFLPVLIISLAGFYFFGKLALGEYYHRQALRSVAAGGGLDSYNKLVRAETLNPQVDLYRVNLAQTNFALANAIAAKANPSTGSTSSPQAGSGQAEASPGGSLTNADKTNIQQLLSQSIAEGRAAVALSPRSALNWEILALIYRQISGVSQNALQFSLDSYGRAITLDPLNPLLRLAVGGVYYQVKNYDLAVRFFDDAVSLKPDFGNALYNLAIALREKGSLQEGILVAERLVALLQDKPDSKDYQVASDLLKELREKIPSTTQPPAATQSAALEKQNLPKVLDVGKPEKIATPPAVKR